MWLLTFPYVVFVLAAKEAFGFAPSPRSSGRDSSVCRFVSASSTSEPSVDSQTSTSNIRPLHQNWWPVTLVQALDSDRPNAIELLGMRLVLVPDGNGGWTCLDDRCSHRFAPLSEGRMVKDQNGETCIQCAYHGWEFDTAGKCTKVPQLESSGGFGRSVQAYPVRSSTGMIWVWSDPSSSIMSDAIPLPISPLLERFYAVHGDSSGFMRDLPYGVEILGENLLDLSHLPFSHHSVGGLDREIGGPLPLRMLSESERSELASGDAAVPLFQAQVKDAAQHDPIFLGMAKSMGPSRVPSNSTTTIAFFDPCHVRYHRVSMNDMAVDVQLFMCPTSAGKSRVMLFNVFESFLPPLNATVDEITQKTFKERLASLSPKAVIAKAKKSLIGRLFSPGSVKSHMMSHAIFDGDGIFLHKQGDRMRRSGLTFRDYSTPSSADVLLNAYRRYLDSSAKQAADRGATSAYESVGSEQYFDDEARSQLLDRYESHTVHCKVCSDALETCWRRRDRLAVASTALAGAAGTSWTALTALSAIALSSGVSIAPIFLRVAALAALSTTAGSVAAARAATKQHSESEKFLFEDYVHADKP